MSDDDVSVVTLQQLEKRESQSESIFPIGKKYVDSHPTIKPITAIGCGALDGLLGNVEVLYDLGKFAVESTIKSYVRQTNYFKEVALAAMKGQLFKKISEDAKETWQNYKTKVTNTYNQIKDLSVESVSMKIEENIKQYFTTLVGGTKEGYYKVGQLIFEVALLVLSGGTGAAVKVAAKTATKVVNKLDDIGSFFSNVGQAASQGGVAAKKWFRCRILGNGCFVKDTPVLMARNANQYSLLSPAKAVAFAAAMPIVAVPIQEVNLLDYAVSHKTVNQQNNLIASTNEDIYSGLFRGDPYTSQQQKQKDKFEINDTDWNEVVFKEVYGSSIAKLALHRDWIKQNNYAVHGIVNMNLPEQGISGPFKITSIKHILPQKKPVDEDPNDVYPVQSNGDYEYKPVTGLFIHHSDQVLNITLNNNETLGVTAPHPIFSTTYNAWRLAGELEVGEKVLTYHGEATVTKAEKKSGREVVYNLEVKDLHNFLVGDVGVVVHNSYAEEVKNFIYKMSKGDKQSVIDDAWGLGFPEWFQRGRFMEELLGATRYNGWSWTGNISSNFPGIDFYKKVAGKNVAASIKTTKNETVSKWLTSNRGHLNDLRNGKLTGEFSQGNSKILVDQVELHIYTPKSNFSQSMEAQWTAAINAEFPEIKIIISDVEKHVGL